MSVIAVVGNRKSGKTTVIETLTKELTRKGYKVATVKHISEQDFTIDTQGKDTWRHQKAGAHLTISVAPREMAIIRKNDTTKYRLSDILQHCQNQADLIILEGFRHLIAQNLNIPKILTVKTRKEMEEAMKHLKPLIAIVSPHPTKLKIAIPQIDVAKNPEKLTEMVENKIKTAAKKRKTLKPSIKIEIDEKPVPLNRFVQKIMRAVILSMVSTLKNVSIKGDENISISIRGSLTED
jgi:molybdopterin-guanine dinucleotide biosynthesis protein MobB